MCENCPEVQSDPIEVESKWMPIHPGAGYTEGAVVNATVTTGGGESWVVYTRAKQIAGERPLVNPERVFRSKYIPAPMFKEGDVIDIPHGGKYLVVDGGRRVRALGTDFTAAALDLNKYKKIN